MDDKENTAPVVVGQIGSIFQHDAAKKGRSRSLGPAELSSQALDRRRSAVRGILPGQEDAERKAARRKSMADRRVSFAPEATLHTWDVIDYLREHTNSTASSDAARVAEHEDTDEESDEDAEGSEEEDLTESVGLDMENFTQETATSNGSSTSSSAQLERNLQLAAHTAGTRGIAFDEYGDMSMSMVDEEITDAFKPWVQQEEVDQYRGSAVFDQENIDPYLIQQTKPHVEGDLSFSDDEQTMDFTSVALQQPNDADNVTGGQSPRKRSAEEMDQQYLQASPSKRIRMQGPQDEDVQTMQLTQAFGSIQQTQASGSHQQLGRPSFASIDENEDMSMELTTVLAGYTAQPADAATVSPVDEGPVTPTKSPASARSAKSRRQSASPARRTSARIRTSTGRSPASTSKDSRKQAVQVLSSPATPRTGVRKEADELSDNMLTPKQATSPHNRPDDVVQSSPFLSVAASPAVYHRNSTHPFSLPFIPEIQPPALEDKLRLLSTPRKETLKILSPKRRTPSPSKSSRTARHAEMRLRSSPLSTVMLASDLPETHAVSLQDFLDEANIRFMELTTSKRRATIAPTPSKLRVADELDQGLATISLDDAIVSAACTEPELELYKHACNELRRYIDGGKADIKLLEEATLTDTPGLIRRYMAADKLERASIDAELREIKTNARLRSKEMWYSWRSNLVDDLMKVLQSIAEGLLSDDDILQEKEALINDILPPLQEEREGLRAEVDTLQAADQAIPPDEKAELDEVREQLLALSRSMETRQRTLDELEAQFTQRNDRIVELDRRKQDCIEVIGRSETLKATADTTSAQKIAGLQRSIDELESSTGWKVLSVESIPTGDIVPAKPASMTMSYRSQLEFSFQPLAFSNDTATPAQNGPLSLTHVKQQHAVSTCERFFLQLLRAQLHNIPQASTKINAVLRMISSTWDTALNIMEAMRCMSIECPTRELIQNDECLHIESCILLPSIKAKATATLKLTFNTQSPSEVHMITGTDVKIIYGNAANREQAAKLFSEAAASPSSWAMALRQVQDLFRKVAHKGIPRRAQ